MFVCLFVFTEGLSDLHPRLNIMLGHMYKLMHFLIMLKFPSVWILFYFILKFY